MGEALENGDDLMSKISKNVESHLQSFQQRSAWDTATSLGYSNNLTQLNPDPKSSTKLPVLDCGEDDDLEGALGDTIVNQSGASLHYKQPVASSSLNIQDWSSPVSGKATKNNLFNPSITDITTQNNFKNQCSSDELSMNYTSARPSNININVTNNQNYINHTTFTSSESLKSNSLLRLADVLCQNILLHPFVALRRSCQVNRKCSSYLCIQPFSLVPLLYRRQRKYGISGYYKGLSSVLLVKGLTLGTETALANHLRWPTEVGSKKCLENSFKVMILRGISVALSTPFLCSSVIETVQSVIVVKDTPSFVDCLREGFWRLLHLRSSLTTRIMPIWLIVLPTVGYHVLHLAIWYLSKSMIGLSKVKLISSSKTRNSKRLLAQDNRRQYSTLDSSSYPTQDLTLDYDMTNISYESDSIEKSCSEITNSTIASLVADIALLPIETVLNSLYIQGTRTIIDNCDETTVVLPVLTNYDGFTDCYQSILRFEGNLGLYKGLGAIILQYSVHFLLFRSIYYLVREFQATNVGGNSKSKSINLDKRHQLQPNVKPSNECPGNNRHSTPNEASTYNRFKERNHYKYKNHDLL